MPDAHMAFGLEIRMCLQQKYHTQVHSHFSECTDEIQYYRRIPSEEALSSSLILLVGHAHNWQLCIYNLSVDLAMSETHDPQRSPGKHARRKVSVPLLGLYAGGAGQTLQLAFCGH